LPRKYPRASTDVKEGKDGRYDLTEFEWKVIQPLLPNKPSEYRFVAKEET
jgi:hypothetical protein